MPTYSVTTTTAQDRAVSWLVRRENQRRAAQSLPPLTTAQAVQEILDRAVNDIAEGFRDRVKTGVVEAYNGAAAATQTNVRAALGIDPDTII